MSGLVVPNPSTMAPGNLVTGAIWNAQVRDAINYLINPPLCVLKQTVAQSVPNATNTSLKMNATIVDSYGGYNSTTGVYTSQAAGWYQCTGTAIYSNNTTGYRIAGMAVNQAIDGSGNFTNPTAVLAVNGAMNTVGASPGGRTSVIVTNLVYLNVGDYIQLYGYQTSGGALNTELQTYAYSSFQIVWAHN